MKIKSLLNWDNLDTTPAAPSSGAVSYLKNGVIEVKEAGGVVTRTVSGVEVGPVGEAIFNNPLVLNSGITFGPGIEVDIDAKTDDLVIPNVSGGVTVCLNFSGNYKLTGIQVPDPTKSYLLFVKNTGSGGVLRNNDPGSIAQNRFLIPGGNTNFSNKSAILVYDTIAMRWQIYGL